MQANCHSPRQMGSTSGDPSGVCDTSTPAVAYLAWRVMICLRMGHSQSKVATQRQTCSFAQNGNMPAGLFPGSMHCFPVNVHSSSMLPYMVDKCHMSKCVGCCMHVQEQPADTCDASYAWHLPFGLQFFVIIFCLSLCTEKNSKSQRYDAVAPATASF